MKIFFIFSGFLLSFQVLATDPASAGASQAGKLHSGTINTRQHAEDIQAVGQPLIIQDTYIVDTLEEGCGTSAMGMPEGQCDEGEVRFNKDKKSPDRH